MQKKLKFRHEMKYYVNYHQYHLIRHRLKHFLHQDSHADHKGEYHIRSVYFDDMEDKALQEKQAGVENRNKYRARFYNGDDSVIHFEKKIKRNTFIAKQKAAISRSTLDRLIKGDFTVLQDTTSPLLKEVHYEMKNRLLRPKVIVDYVREAYIAKEGNVRITFDKDLRTGLQKIDPFDKDLYPVKALDEPVYILEVKFDEYIPNYIRDALQLNGLQRQAASKYTICRKFTKKNAWEDQ
ncbi:polyphosphate polymerase domain-containing protein [Jeotgalibacillus sp. S-D1]|uniref:polyphosphate polymerase domain-containing protein n=1 Tax=Jeotgalibacillus sp. S-D1 TaxID=2552189 RepID=UPI0010594073|nr:polyphosphate polymerase domain-containing protein [Jeotgalibacillus sp. S-D1]TDL30672.1 polyphosphate polymerase domain-containing protein [Jeotgalibacillus sp. S-D1]